MTRQQICLKWNSFQSNIVTCFETLWEEEGLVDCTLASEGQCIRAHKVILSACSPFFRRIFETNPCQHPVIILQDVQFSDLEALLCFVYKGEVNIDQDDLPALLKAAESLQIRGLCTASAQGKVKHSLIPSESGPPSKKKRPSSACSSLPPPPAALPVQSALHRSQSLEESEDISTSLQATVIPKVEPSCDTNCDDSESLASLPLEESMDEGTPEELQKFMQRQGEKLSLADINQLKGCCRTDSLAFHSDLNFDPSKDSASSFPPFPCPFCDRAYTSWGFRRRHIKSMHTSSPKLTCKWCPQVLNNHNSWENHVTGKHGLAAEDARNGLLILEEAHTVLQIPNPTKLESLVDMIKRGEVVTEPVQSQSGESSSSRSKH
ncbi:zinc finger and BTB domain-containing protein 14-like isoform X1 [Neocloeon triangulifer]|uniref:zinc finger and BTB domain-containing protein 14-like isoform X1 n=1 Tax=Neocloeon triangulifer TaxID=2078957 RepID=UPI00286F673A|nr:zinc finger and BTB domain-containing protein 14-like isoform X1 [Neocloeon triangulifer]